MLTLHALRANTIYRNFRAVIMVEGIAYVPDGEDGSKGKGEGGECLIDGHRKLMQAIKERLLHLTVEPGQGFEGLLFKLCACMWRDVYMCKRAFGGCVGMLKWAGALLPGSAALRNCFLRLLQGQWQHTHTWFISYDRMGVSTQVRNGVPSWWSCGRNARDVHAQENTHVNKYEDTQRTGPAG